MKLSSNITYLIGTKKQVKTIFRSATVYKTITTKLS